MADLEHKNIADPNIHEPKGVASAAANQVYVADGLGSGSWTTRVANVEQGIYDYNDLATATTPIALTVAGTQYELTNDGAGANTNLLYPLSGMPDIWDTSTNRFDFTNGSGLALGDTVDLRLTIAVTTTTANTAVDVDLELGVGVTPYQVNILNAADKKAAGTYTFSIWTNIYMGNSLTLDNPGRILASADKTGATVEISGWYFRPLRNS